jgi:MoaA/NifB/PqqE/SkfB family radical SAM enzyme
MSLRNAARATINFIDHHASLQSLLHHPLRFAFDRRDLRADKATFRAIQARHFMPVLVYVQISRRCNLQCQMCGWAVWQRNKGFMSLDLFRRVLEEMKANGLKELALSNPQGEPLLSPHAKECIDLAIVEGFAVNMNSNCTTLANRNIETIAIAARTGRFSVQASFSGYDKETHEAVYVGSKFEDSAQKLQACNARLKAEGLEKHLTVTGIIYDPSQTERHLAFLETLGIERSRVHIRLPDNFAGIVKVGKYDRLKGLHSLKGNLSYRSLRLCSVLAHSILIYDDGKVSACACRDSEGLMEVGDLTKQSLAEIQSGPRYLALIESFMKRDISGLPLCLKCDVPYGDKMQETLFQ